MLTLPFPLMFIDRQIHVYQYIYVTTISNAFRVLPLPYITWACGTKLLICTAYMNHISEQLLQQTKSTVVVAGFKHIRFKPRHQKCIMYSICIKMTNCCLITITSRAVHSVYLTPSLVHVLAVICAGIDQGLQIIQYFHMIHNFQHLQI